MQLEPPSRGFVSRISIVAASVIAIAACRGSAPAPSDASSSAKAAPPDADVAASSDAGPVDAGRIGSSEGCPSDMIRIQGSYCPNAVHQCLKWMDPRDSQYWDYRCAQYKEPATCNGARVDKKFCIDREEYQKEGDTLPLAHQSWTSAGAICTAQGKRLCLESEWQFACEGEEMRPYPYGFKRGDSTLCNIDRMDLGKPNAGLRDNRAPLSAHPQCLSPFGVHNMSGNVEEWVTQDQGVAPQRSSMKGAWWLPGKNTCRARTIGHGEVYEGAQVGVRCCADVKSP